VCGEVGRERDPPGVFLDELFKEVARPGVLGVERRHVSLVEETHLLDVAHSPGLTQKRIHYVSDSLPARCLVSCVSVRRCCKQSVATVEGPCGSWWHPKNTRPLVNRVKQRDRCMQRTCLRCW
jgi:hypothetical protein